MAAAPSSFPSGTQTHGPGAANPGRGSAASEARPGLLRQVGGCPSRGHPPSDRELLMAAASFLSFLLSSPIPGTLPRKSCASLFGLGLLQRRWCLSHQTRGFPRRHCSCPIRWDSFWGGLQGALRRPSDSNFPCSATSSPTEPHSLHPRLEIWVLILRLASVSLIQSSIHLSIHSFILQKLSEYLLCAKH